MTSAGRAAA
jgi:hypothetical protein